MLLIDDKKSADVFLLELLFDKKCNEIFGNKYPDIWK